MKPDKATVYEVFQLEKRYVVPLYQRPYVWKEDDHWAPLWDDIEAKAVSLASGEPAGPHFLGAIVLTQLKVGLRQIAASQVIDGQQRLTTLQVFLAVFRDVVTEVTSDEQDPETRETLATIAKMLSQITEHTNVLGSKEDRFKVWPTNADRVVFDCVMTARSRAAVDARYPTQHTGKRKKVPIPGPRLVEAYRFFDQRVRDHLSPEPSRPYGRKEAALGLFEAVRRCLQLVVIDLEEKDDPQVIFETLNARGEPLLPSDLIRNLVFNRAGQDADVIYETCWKHYDENAVDGSDGFWKTKVKQGRETRPVLDLFFHSYLSSRVDGIVPLGRLFDEFRRWWEAQKARPVRETLEELGRYADAYRAFHQPERLPPTDRRLATFARRLRVLDTAMVFPVLLFLVVDMAPRVPASERDVMLTDLESFLVRRWLCGVTTKNYNRLFSTLLQDLRTLPALDRTAFRARLAQGSGVDRWPDDREFEAAWTREPVYERLPSQGVQMVLRAIHDNMLSKKQEPVAIPEALTVEHVMPRAWRNHWDPPAAQPEMPEETGEERRDRLIHTFGNLTLLTQELNSDVRDGVFTIKQREITRQSLLLLNAYFQETASWDERAIVERGRGLFDHARAVWPAPPSAIV